MLYALVIDIRIDERRHASNSARKKAGTFW